MIKIDFEKTYPKKIKIFFYIGLMLLGIFWLSMLIYTSWYENDLKLTKQFGDLGFYKDWVRGISGYFVQDGYFILTSFIIPMVVLLLESIAHYLKNNYQSPKFFQFYVRNRKYLQFFVLICWTIAIFQICYSRLIADHGFGLGFDGDAMLGWNYVIPTIIFLIIFNNLISWTLGYVIMYKLGTKPDFLAQNYWKKGLYFFFYIAIAYLVIGFLKLGFGRPSYMTLFWGDELEWFKTANFERWEIYMSHDGFHLYGWEFPGQFYDIEHHPEYINIAWQNAPGDFWPWWQPSQFGLFYTNGPSFPSNKFLLDNAFPSGHLISCAGAIVGVTVLLSQRQKTQRMSQLKAVCFIMAIAYFVNMIFALGFTYGHWMSDMAFSVVWAILSYFLAHMLNEVFINKGLEKLDQALQKRFKPISKSVLV